MRLDSWLARQPRGTHAELGRAARVSWNAIYEIRKGYARPRLAVALAIEEFTGGAVSARDLAAEPRVERPWADRRRKRARRASRR